MTKPIREAHREFISVVDSVREFERWFFNLKRRFKIPPKEFDKIYLASNEAFINALIHGNKLDPERKVLVDFKEFKRSYRVDVQDQGGGFEPEQVPDPRKDENLLKESGRGLLIIREVADEVKFYREKFGMRIKIKIKKRSGARKLSHPIANGGATAG
jgi:serine/threonine-protein kinase RsbW